MQVRLIANPNASGVLGALIDQVAARLARVGDVEVRLTERPGHAIELARAPGADVVVAMGGDGTANEVANGMPPDALMGVVPAGASSVFARQLRLPRQTLAAAAVLAVRDRRAALARRRPGLGERPHVHVLGRHGPRGRGHADRGRAAPSAPGRPQARAICAVVAAAGRVLRADRLSMPARITVTAGDRTVLRAHTWRSQTSIPTHTSGRLPVRTTPRAELCVGAGRRGRVGLRRTRPLAAAGLRAAVAAARARRRPPRQPTCTTWPALDVACDAPVRAAAGRRVPGAGRGGRGALPPGRR